MTVTDLGYCKFATVPIISQADVLKTSAYFTSNINTSSSKFKCPLWGEFARAPGAVITVLGRIWYIGIYSRVLCDQIQGRRQIFRETFKVIQCSTGHCAELHGQCRIRQCHRCWALPSTALPSTALPKPAPVTLPNSALPFSALPNSAPATLPHRICTAQSCTV